MKSLVWSRFCLLFCFRSILIRFLKKNHDLHSNVDFFVTDVYNFSITAQHCNTGNAYIVCKQNRGCDSGGNNNNLKTLKHTIICCFAQMQRMSHYYKVIVCHAQCMDAEYAN